MRRIALCSVVLIASLSSGAAAQTVEEGSPDETRSVLANPVRPTFADNAYFIRSGELQLETGYLASIFEDDVGTLHAVEILSILGVGDLFEARLRWNVFNVWQEETGIGDVALGLKGGFFGGWGENTALAGLFEIQFPAGMEPFGIDKGVALSGGLVATQPWSSFQFDLQAGVYTHLFQEDPTIQLPLALSVAWSPIGALRVLGELVERLDLTDLSDSTTSVLGGLGYLITPQVMVDGSIRVGLSQSLPDIQVGAGVTWLVARFF